MTLGRGADIYAPGGRLLEDGDLLEQPGLEAALEALAAEGASQRLLGLDRRRAARRRRDLRDGRRLERLCTGLVVARPRGMGLRACSDSDRAFRRAGPLRPAAAADEVTETERVLALATRLRRRPSRGRRPHDQHRRRRPRRARVRADHEPRPRLRRLPAGVRPAPEQHARRSRSGSRPPPARRADGEHDGADARRRLGWAGSGDRRGRRHEAGYRARERGRGRARRTPRSGRRAVARPRFHPVGELVNAEPGVDEAALERIEAAGRPVRRWDSAHHYFGGVSLSARAGVAADPRRSRSRALEL